ncbi:endolytic transglycosylase MltG [Paenibacillus illinoisensis]|uniref:endolytic transglycosylase MltG n=1 Tax=Paenibacillus illinoisensis TaxID=59845 RepID=UPI00203CFB54|nr:endolytic transglycosylase MltG [Paenibacillus illinoisensis]MCM3206353.1 endolytic transglycosylase MltG [Paenibacillus illinoisensis]
MKGKAIVVVLLIIVIAAGGAGAAVWNMMRPVAASADPVVFEIKSGSGTSQIADQLEQEGLIRSGLAFKGYLKWKKQGSSFMAGTYSMNPGVPYDEIISKLNSGEVVPEEMVKFTIPEGYTVLQMADKLSAEGVVDREEFIKLANDPSSFDVDIIKDIPVDEELRYVLEGYLFPETYELKKGSSTHDVMQRMLEEFQTKINTIPDLDTKLKARNLSLHELITIASLVEREVVVDEERALVAGVIDNRIKQDMKLEIDATVQYLLDKPKARLLFKDLKVKSPYNSYLNKGLPPGPIASPSLESIEAALAPEASDYLFYVTKKDGSSGHLFAKTYKEHQQNIAKSKAAQ